MLAPEWGFYRDITAPGWRFWPYRGLKAHIPTPWPLPPIQQNITTTLVDWNSWSLLQTATTPPTQPIVPLFVLQYVMDTSYRDVLICVIILFIWFVCRVATLRQGLVTVTGWHVYAIMSSQYYRWPYHNYIFLITHVLVLINDVLYLQLWTTYLCN